MSLATRCTHCLTIFRITPEQLQAAEGWVRCGQCTQVFEAAAHLVQPDGQPLNIPTLAQDDTAPPSYDGTRGQSTPAALGTPGDFPAMPDIDLELPELPTAPPGGASAVAGSPLEPVWAEPQTAAAAAAAEALNPEAPGSAASVATAEPARWDSVRAGASAPAASSAGRTPAIPDRDVASTAGSDTGFKWLAAACALLIPLQLVIAARAHIVQAVPEARAALEALCAPLRCEVPSMRLLQALEVQNSSLSRHAENNGQYTLNVLLRNPSAAQVELPALDFLIKDEVGTVLARKTLRHQDAKHPTGWVGAAASERLIFELDLQALGQPVVSSYSVEPFYP